MDKNVKDAKDRLIAAATILFAKKGFSGVSIREVATAANANSALISYHFGGKEGLYQAVLLQQLEKIAAKIGQIEAAEISCEAKLREYAQTIKNTHQMQPYLMELMLSEMANPTEFFESVIKRFVGGFARFLSGVIATGVERGEFRPDLHPLFSALALAGMMNFYFRARPLVKLLHAPEGDMDEIFVSQAIEIYLTGIRRCAM